MRGWSYIGKHGLCWSLSLQDKVDGNKIKDIPLLLAPLPSHQVTVFGVLAFLDLGIGWLLRIFGWVYVCELTQGLL